VSGAKGAKSPQETPENEPPPKAAAQWPEKPETAQRADTEPARAPGRDVATVKPQPKPPAKAAPTDVAKPAKTETAPARQQPKAKPAPVFTLPNMPEPAVRPARAKRRHWFVLVSLLLIVVLPSAAVVWYLWDRATDRYASTTAFSVHREDTSGALDALAGLPSMGVPMGGTPDADILYQFIRSQRMVEAVDAEIDLRASFGARHDVDPIFALDPEASLEDMISYWDRILSIVFEPDTGLLTVEATAFEPDTARSIARVILAESGDLVDRLSKIARDDTIRQAQAELDKAAERLKAVRLEMSRFRDIEQIIDPAADFSGQMGVITALQQSLADAMIRRDMLVGTTTNPDDPRLQQAERTIAAIEKRIEEERLKVGARTQTADGDPLSRVVGEYESLVVDRQFAEQSYMAALAAYDAAMSEARRRSRYLAVHVEPTLAQTAIYPNRVVLSAVAIAFLLMVWTIFALTYYSIRDRR